MGNDSKNVIYVIKCLELQTISIVTYLSLLIYSAIIKYFWGRRVRSQTRYDVLPAKGSIDCPVFWA